MMYYRNKKPGKHNKGSPKRSEHARTEQELVVCERRKTLAVHEQYMFTFALDTAEAQPLRGHPEDPLYVYPSTSAAWWVADSKSEWVVDTEEAETLSHELGYTGRRSAAGLKVIKYEHSDSHADLQMRLLVGKLATSFRVGDGVDPFGVLPQFRNPELNAVYLIRRCKSCN